MPFNITSTLRSLEGYLASQGDLVAVIGEPKSPPQNEMHAAIFMDSARVYAVDAAGGTIEAHTVVVRFMRNMFGEPQIDIEAGLAELVQRCAAAVLADADLGATIRNVDVAGETGDPLRAQWGYVDVGGVMYRSADLFVPLIVDGSATAVP